MKDGILSAVMLFCASQVFAQDVPSEYDLAPLSTDEEQILTSLVNSGKLTDADLMARYSRCSYLQPDDLVQCITDMTTPDWIELASIDPITDSAQYITMYQIDENRTLFLGCRGSEDIVALQTGTALSSDETDVIVRFGKEEPKKQAWEVGGDAYGLKLERENATDFIRRTYGSNRVALRYYGVSGEETVLVNLENFVEQSSRVARDCGWNS